jgi:hypothetical protein
MLVYSRPELIGLPDVEMAPDRAISANAEEEVYARPGIFISQASLGILGAGTHKAKSGPIGLLN